MASSEDIERNDWNTEESTEEEAREHKAKKVNYANDENQERGNWSNQAEFLLSLLGFAVGLGNVWRFPYLCYRNGGAIFLIPYMCMMVFVGMPIFTMELCLGQFVSAGPVACWKMSRLFSGLGWGMVCVSAMVSIYYNMIIGWAIYYFVASFIELPRDALPWDKCIIEDSNPYCMDFLSPFNSKNCTAELGYTPRPDGVCIYANGTKNPLSGNTTVELGFWDKDLALENHHKLMVPSESYLFYHVWGRSYVNGLKDIGDLKWQLALCLLAAWVLVYLCLIKGIKSSGKVVYFTALFPYVMLLVLLIRGVMLPGHEMGVQFYMTPKYEKLMEAQVWMDAAVQVFFSLSASWGGIIALSSYNKFHNDSIRDSLIVSIGDCLTSFFAGFVIFVWLGFLAYETGSTVDDVISSGTGLAFVVYTRAVAAIPASPLWSILFFMMLITIGLDSEFSLVETILTSYLDIFPQHRKRKWLVMLVLCSIMYLLGLVLCAQGGTYMFDLLDKYSGGWNVLLIALLECACIAYAYGIRRFIKDIEVMITPTGCFPAWYCFKYWWIGCWCFFTPASVTFVMMFDWLNYKPLKYDNGEPFEEWAQALGWMCTFAVIIALIIPPVYYFIRESGSFTERMLAIINPTVDWGPALVQHRQLITYVDGWIVDPNNSSLKQSTNKVNGASTNTINSVNSGQVYGNHAFSADYHF